MSPLLSNGMTTRRAHEASSLGIFGRLSAELRKDIYDLLEPNVHLVLPTVQVQAYDSITQLPSSLTCGSSLSGPCSSIAATSKALRQELAEHVMSGRPAQRFLKIKSRYTDTGIFSSEGTPISAIDIPDSFTSLFIRVEISGAMSSDLYGLRANRPMVKRHWDSLGLPGILGLALRRAKSLEYVILQVRLYDCDGKEYCLKIGISISGAFGLWPPGLKEACVNFHHKYGLCQSWRPSDLTEDSVHWSSERPFRDVDEDDMRMLWRGCWIERGDDSVCDNIQQLWAAGHEKIPW